MHPTFLVLLATLATTHSLTRIYFTKCGQKGFSCVNNSNDNKKLDITYQCPSGVNDAALFINQFQSPVNIETLKIQNCKSLTVSTRCSGENRFFQRLEVVNIELLSFQRLQFAPMLPPTVVLENITFVDVVPSFTFGQIEKSYHTSGCVIPKTLDFQNIYLRNVSIDLIQSNAFVGLNQFHNFSFINVKIKRLQTSAIQLKLDLKGGFEMRNCAIDTVEPLGMQVYGKRALFSDNRFGEIAPSGLNGTMEDFYFTKNFVELLEPQGFAVLATNIFILDNNFLHFKSGALEKLSPGLVQDSGRNFGKLKFVYDFSKNTLNYLEVGSLHPDVDSYDHVQTEMMFSRNTLSCSCDNIGWLFNYSHPQLEPFYEMVLDDGYANKCDMSSFGGCELLLKKAGVLVNCGKCSKNMTLESLCQKQDKFVEATMRYQGLDEDIPQDLLIPGNETEAAAAREATASYLLLTCLYILTICGQYYY